MSNDAVKSFLNDAGHFTRNFELALINLLHNETYKPKQIIYAAGQIELNIYLIESGFARSYYYDHHGIEHTVRFWSSGQLIFSCEGYYKIPSLYYTEFMEKSLAIALSYTDFAEIRNAFPETSLLIRNMLIKSRKIDHERQILLTLPANERYAWLYKQNHIIFQKSPVKFIASYLNMTRETLARLMGRK